MAVAKVRLMANGRTVDAYALLDQGANSSLITDSLAKALHLKGTNSPIQFHNVFGKDTISTRETSFDVCVANGEAFTVSAYTKPRINMYRKTLNWERAKETCGHLADLPPPVPGHCTIGLLIGMDMVKLHLQEEVRPPPPGAIGP